MKVVVTGGLGFIGSHLADKLFAEGHEVYILDDLSGGSLMNNSKCTFYHCDLRDAERADACFKAIKPEIVYALAANAAEQKSSFSPIDITSRNYDAFIKTITPAIKYGVKRIVFTSSIAVYGALQTPFKETDDPHPEDLYGISKLACEQSLKILSKVHGFEYVIARPHNVYGPRQNMSDPYRNVVTIWMNAMLRREPWYIYGNGEQQRCFSYIDDVVEALYTCGFKNVAGMTFNIGSSRNYSLNDLAEIMQHMMQTHSKPIYLPARQQEVQMAIADHKQAMKYLRYNDVTDLDKGLLETAIWAQDQGPQEPKYTEIEIPSPKLPENWRK